MISLHKADQIMQKEIKPFKVVKQSLLESYGSILQEDIVADRDMPAFDKSLMDGIAINHKTYQQGVRKFPVVGTQSAGIPALNLKFDYCCVEIMTGAVLSKGCDCVIPIEEVQIEDGKAMVKDGLTLTKWQHIRRQGADHKKEKILIKKGSVLGPIQIATASAVGAAMVKVSMRPKVAVISSGDELVDIDVRIKPFQIRKSNSFFMQAALQKTQLFDTDLFHFKDNLKILRKQIGAILEKYDVLILTGGVSMGKFDLIPQAMDELGVKVVFHKVKQKPGKPFWFGLSKDKKPVFALPGNPVSTQVGMYRHVIPHLLSALGVKPKKEYVELTASLKPNTQFSFFCPVVLDASDDAKLKGKPYTISGSGDLASMVKSDGFIEIPDGGQEVKQGYVARFYRW